MEPGFPAFRNRKFARRADYMPLENDSDADSYRRPNSHVTQRSCDTRVVLCDKCWLRHERSRACKRCLDCNQNLCKSCARCDEVVQPWWLPNWVFNCWRCLFTDVYKPHTLVDLQTCGSNNEQQHWAHETNQMQGIPRLSRNSLRSHRSRDSAESTPIRHRGRPNSVCSDKERYTRGRRSPRDENKQLRRLQYSQSFDGRPRRSLERSCTSSALVHNYRHDDIERLRSYKDNWERAFDANSHDYVRQMPFRNKLIGKDVMIELTDTDAKVVVNEGRDKYRQKRKASSLDKKKSRVKSSAPGSLTEQVFEEVPIWFKKSQKGNQSNDSAEYVSFRKKFSDFPRNDTKRDTEYIFSDARARTNRNTRGSFGIYGNDRPKTSERKPYSEPRTDYIVEEPADSCPICLEDLPGLEARSLSCSHVFHTKCLKHFLSSTSDMDFGIKCPVCSQMTFIKNYYTSKDNWLQELSISSSV